MIGNKYGTPSRVLPPSSLITSAHPFAEDSKKDSLLTRTYTHLSQALAAYIVIDDREQVWDAVSRPALMQVLPFTAFNFNGTIITPPRNAYGR
jgi:hypothetical protein